MVTKIYDNIKKDYEENFLPRKETIVSLSIDDIESVLKEQEIQDSMDTAWHYKFYIKQLVVSTVAKLVDQNKLNEDVSIQMGLTFNRLYEEHKISGTNKTRAILFQVLIEHFPWCLSKFDLYEAFAGTSIYDDHCAQIAFRRWELLKE